MPFLGKVPSQIVDSDVDIDGGTIDGATIGSITAGAGTFTNLSATGTITFPDDGISGDDINGGTISNFTSTGIDDNATSTAITIDSDGDVGIGLASPLFQAADRTAVTINGTTSSNLVFGVGGSANTYFLADSGGFTIGNTSASLPTMFYTNSAERMRIDSSGNVILNQSAGAADNTILRITGGTAGFSTLHLADTADINIGYVQYDHTNNALTFASNNAERMRIDSSGRVFIGKTSDNDNTAGHTLHSSGLAVHTRNSSFAAIFNRTTNDGDIAQFKKDGALVGSIGNDSTALTIGSGSTGIKFGTAAVWATTGGSTNSNGAKDLGASTVRWKDLYLSNNISLSNASTSAFLQVSTNILQFGTSSSDPVAFYSNNAERMRIQPTGEVSIGSTTTGQAAVNINGVGSSYGEIDAFVYGIGWNMPLVLQRQGGNIGVGTTSVLGSLTEKTIHLASATTNDYATIYVTNSNNSVKGVFSSDGNLGQITLGAQSNHPILFSTNNTERLRIDSNGVIKPSSTSSTGFVANQYSTAAGNSFTVTLPSVYGVYELAIFAGRNDAGAYGSRHQVYHVAGLGGYPYTAWPPVVNLVSDIQRPQTSSPPTVSVSTGVNGSITLTLGGTGASYSGYALKLLTTGQAY